MRYRPSLGVRTGASAREVRITASAPSRIYVTALEARARLHVVTRPKTLLRVGRPGAMPPDPEERVTALEDVIKVRAAHAAL